jgi:hypothetical protein
MELGMEPRVRGVMVASPSMVKFAIPRPIGDAGLVEGAVGADLSLSSVKGDEGS